MAHVPESEPRPRMGLIEARNDRRMSQQQLADELGTTHVNVSRWERGITKPNPYFRRKLARLFNKTEQELDLVPAPSAGEDASAAPPTEAAASEPQACYDPVIPLLPAIRLVGRDEELARIKRRLFAGGNVALTALNGLPGVGKTALATALAHDSDIRRHFKDGILWAGLGPNPNIPGLLSRWGGLLGISSTEMAGLSGGEAWARALRGAIGSRQMLLVIDDAWTLEEALTFKVGGGRCAHLLTTRFPDIASSIAFDGATRIEELSTEESMKLLRLLAPGVVDREAQKALDLVQAVGGLPLALTLMGNYLRKQAYSGQTRRITAALERLSNAFERLQISEPLGPVESHPSLSGETLLSLHSVIAVTDQLLSDEARAALYALAVFPPRPSSFSEEAALAVTAGPVEALDLLIDSGMLESNGPGRYSLHQTIADYARTHLSDDDPYRRLVQYVVEFVEEHKKDYALLEQESSTILAALEQAHDLEMREELVRAALAYAPFMLSRGFYAQAEKHMQRAHDAAVTLQARDSETSTLIYLGEIAHQQGNLAQAESIFQEGLRIARELGNKEQISALLNDLGWVEQKQGNLAQAEEYLQDGLDIARQIGDKERICGILKVLGSVANYKGNFVQAEVFLQEGLTLSRQIEDHEQECLLLINLGVAVAEQGRFSQAEVYFRESLDLARQSGYRERICILLANLGAVANEQGDYLKAEKYFFEGLEIGRQIENPERTCLLLSNLGVSMRMQGKYSEAEPYLNESLILARQIGSPHITANALYEYSNLCLDRHQLDPAKSMLNEMLLNIPEGNQDLKALAQYGLAQIAASEGNNTEAIHLVDASIIVLEKIGHRKYEEVKQWRSSIMA